MTRRILTSAALALLGVLTITACGASHTDTSTGTAVSNDAAIAASQVATTTSAVDPTTAPEPADGSLGEDVIALCADITGHTCKPFTSALAKQMAAIICGPSNPFGANPPVSLAADADLWNQLHTATSENC